MRRVANLVAGVTKMEQIALDTESTPKGHPGIEKPSFCAKPSWP